MRYTVAIIPLLLFTACLSEKTAPPKPPKKEIKVLTEEEKFLLKLDKQQKVVYHNLKKYLTQLKSLDENKIVEMTYPKLFLAFSKYTFRRQIFTMANSSQIEIKSFDTKILKIGEVKPFSNGAFAKVAYQSVVTVFFKNPDLYSTESSLNTLYSILVRKHGRKNIYVDVKKRLVTITKEVKMLAIKESPNDWKFVGDNPAYRTFYPNFLPYEILNQI